MSSLGSMSTSGSMPSSSGGGLGCADGSGTGLGSVTGLGILCQRDAACCKQECDQRCHRCCSYPNHSTTFPAGHNSPSPGAPARIDLGGAVTAGTQADRVGLLRSHVSHDRRAVSQRKRGRRSRPLEVTRGTDIALGGLDGRPRTATIPSTRISAPHWSDRGVAQDGEHRGRAYRGRRPGQSPCDRRAWRLGDLGVPGGIAARPPGQVAASGADSVDVLATWCAAA